VAACAVTLLLYRSTVDVQSLATGQLDARACSRESYRQVVRSCTPAKGGCGRIVIDDFATAEEAEALAAIAARGMAMGGGAGGPTILDLQSGALSKGDKFIDVWVAFNVTGTPAFTRSELSAYEEIVRRIQHSLGQHFGVQQAHLTSPTFFSRISADKPPKQANDEYWHSHIDTEQYGSFVYTGLLYLSTATIDFEGGRLLFEREDGQPEAAVSPRRGRLVLFTSGAEFPHHVEKVSSGTRLALTVAFTCFKHAALQDFLGRALAG